MLNNWGIGYEEMKKLRRTSCTSPCPALGIRAATDYQTMGPIAQALSGLTYLSCLPTSPPAGWGWSYMDDTGGMYGAIYALSALYRRTSPAWGSTSTSPSG